MDIDDFRLRVLHRLKKPVEDPKDVARASSLARSSMLELPTGSLEPSLQASHIEKDKELLRALLEFAISPNKPKQWLQVLRLLRFGFLCVLIWRRKCSTACGSDRRRRTVFSC